MEVSNHVQAPNYTKAPNIVKEQTKYDLMSPQRIKDMGTREVQAVCRKVIDRTLYLKGISIQWFPSLSCSTLGCMTKNAIRQ